jgi:hypothetical protein
MCPISFFFFIIMHLFVYNYTIIKSFCLAIPKKKSKFVAVFIENNGIDWCYKRKVLDCPVTHFMND